MRIFIFEEQGRYTMDNFERKIRISTSGYLGIKSGKSKKD
jgi:hypothetical protein